MQLVLLATSDERHFGMLGPLVSVGARSEAVIDYTALDAISAGFSQIVLVVSKQINEEMLAHLGRHWPPSVTYEMVCTDGAAGTAQAVLSALPVINGPFGVANADDYYSPDALEQLRIRLQAAASEPDEIPHVVASTEEPVDEPHLLIGFRLANTVAAADTVTRGICRTDTTGALLDIVEQRVTRLSGDSGETSGFAGVLAGADPGSPAMPLSGDEIVSMNLWGFFPRIGAHLEAALDSFGPPPTATDEDPPQPLLPDVVMDLVRGTLDGFRVVEANGRCVGVTDATDLEFVRREIGLRLPGEPEHGSATGTPKTSM